MWIGAVSIKRILGSHEKSVTDSTQIQALLKSALTDRIFDREVFMKGIDYSYYYEQENDMPENDDI